ncbi:MAG: ROK family protein [Acidimicrobiaceae bacterium]|nr:ROK family protein [Acidimicrobiaceae bacterium]MYD06563.1 ROK family protein [Acidimicrobiaceae bacterium]MYI57478.1 ROK family protein [Acidimicrobiaceae bacterium]
MRASMEHNDHHRLGIDVGGTTIKAAIVDVTNGSLSTPVVTANTPDSATPTSVSVIAANLRKKLEYAGPIGCALPGVVTADALRRAPNLSTTWDSNGALSPLIDTLGLDLVLLNDADAVGLSELRYGPSTDTHGLTVVLTFGTGIGSALLFDGEYIPNAELGELYGPLGPFEHAASGRSISEQHLTPPEWAARAQPYFDHIDQLLSPSHWIVAGGLSESFDDYFALIHVEQPIRVAHLGHHAGIVGAASATRTLNGRRASSKNR